MQLQLQNFSALVANAAAAVQASARSALDLTVGSCLRAILEANAATALWMQWLIVQVLQATRAATSSGADLDSWVGDFALQRLPASPAFGQVQFARFVAQGAAQGAAQVPVGVLVRTADGGQSFAVVADAGNPAYVAASGGYVLGDGIAAVSVPVRAVVAGEAGNVQAGAVSLIASAVPGVDTVANPLAFGGGLAPESDAALRDRFRNYIATRSRATPLAIADAVASVRQGLRASIRENLLPDGSARMGSVVVIVDDGSGSPPAALLAAVAVAVEAVRPVGTQVVVLAPVVVTADVALAISVAADARDAAAAAVTAAIGGWIAGLPLGASLPLSRIAQLAYDASPAVANVTGVLLCGVAADLVAPAGAVLRPGSIAVS